MPTLAESARFRGPVSVGRILLRSTGHPDVMVVSGDPPRFELVDGRHTDGSTIVTTDAANRLLIIWGSSILRQTGQHRRRTSAGRRGQRAAVASGATLATR
jgi:hypothetical protein